MNWKIAENLEALEQTPWREGGVEIKEMKIMCECHNSDADHEIALSNVSRLNELRGFIRDVFALPGVQEAVYDVEAGELADAIERLGEEGRL